MRQLVLVLTLMLVVPATAQAYYGFRLTGYHASPYMRRWTQESKAPLPQVRISVGFGGPAEYGPHSIALPSCCKQGWTHLAIQGLFFHELGHVFDATNMTPAFRAQFRSLAGVPAAWNWWAPIAVERPQVTLDGGYVLLPGTVETKLQPGEMFAEEYAACSLGLTQWQYQRAGYNSYGWLPPAGHDAALCDLIRSAATSNLRAPGVSLRMLPGPWP